MRKILLIAVLFLSSSVDAFAGNPLGEGYYQDYNPLGEGYVQDYNPLGKGYVQDKDLFDDMLGR